MITYEDTRRIFEYDLETGDLLKNGHPVGTNHSLGYLKVKVMKKTYFVHRLIFLYCFGKWPVRLDHKNGNKKDNRLENLHECTHSINNANRGLMKNNTSGFKGVTELKPWGRWKAQVGYDVIGTFNTKLEAALAYDEEAIARYGESAVTNKDLGLL